MEALESAYRECGALCTCLEGLGSHAPFRGPPYREFLHALYNLHHALQYVPARFGVHGVPKRGEYQRVLDMEGSGTKRGEELEGMLCAVLGEDMDTFREAREGYALANVRQIKTSRDLPTSLYYNKLRDRPTHDFYQLSSRVSEQDMWVLFRLGGDGSRDIPQELLDDTVLHEAPDAMPRAGISYVERLMIGPFGCGDDGHVLSVRHGITRENQGLFTRHYYTERHNLQVFSSPRGTDIYPI